MPHVIARMVRQGGKSRFYAARLGGAEDFEEIAPLFGGKQQALPPVAFTRALRDISVVDQLAQDPRQALLGDAQNVEQIGHRHTRAQIDEIDHPVMGAAESLHFEKGIGIAHEIAIGKKEQSHDIDRHLGKIIDCRTYVSLVDIYRMRWHRPSNLLSGSGLIPEPLWFAKW